MHGSVNKFKIYELHFENDCVFVTRSFFKIVSEIQA
jgi:hypothetical protein